MTRNVDGEGTPETPAPELRARDGYGSGGSPFKPPSRQPVLHRLVPVSQHLPGYRGGTLRRDLLAGLTVAALALLVGGCFLVARVIRLGWVADYFSRAVLIGYLHGVAVVLIIGQLSKLLGLDIDAREPLAQLAEVVRELPELDATTLAVGGLCLASLLLLRLRTPKLPGALIVVVAAIAASAALGLASRGVATVGEIPSGLPGLDLPTAPLGDLLALVPGALGSSSSASPTRSSPPGPSPATTASTSAPTPSWPRWARPAWPPASPRASLSGPAAPAPPSMTRWGPAPSSRGCSAPPPSPSCCCS